MLSLQQAHNRLARGKVPGAPRPCIQPLTQRSVAAQAAKLYTAPGSRGLVVQWYLAEADIKEVEVVMLDMKEKKEHKAEDFLKIHPFGKVPAFEDGDVKIFESGAILLYLADRYGKATTPAARAKNAAWVLFANASLNNALFLEAFRDKQMPGMMDVLEGILSKQDYLEGSNFTVSDVAVGSSLLFVPQFFPDLDLSRWPAVCKYMDRLASRAACKATVAARLESGTKLAAKPQ